MIPGYLSWAVAADSVAAGSCPPARPVLQVWPVVVLLHARLSVIAVGPLTAVWGAGANHTSG